MKIATINLLTKMCSEKGLGRGWSKTVCAESRAAADAGKHPLKDYASWWSGPGVYVVTARHLNPVLGRVESFRVDLSENRQQNWRGQRVVMAPHMSGELLNVFLGSMLGDGSLRRQSSTANTIFVEEHGHEQAEYLRWKMSFWGDLVTPAGLTRQPRRKAHHQDAVGFRTVAYPPLNYWHEKFYPDPPETGKRRYTRKCFPEEVVPYITPLGLAVWYMDDGTAGHRPTFSAHPGCHAVAEKILAQYGFTVVLRGKYNLEVQEAERFIELVRPHMHPSLVSKLDSGCLGRAQTIPTEEFLRLVDEGVSGRDMAAHFQTQEIVLQQKADRLGVKLPLAAKGQADLARLVRFEPCGVQGRSYKRIPKELLVDLLAAGTTLHRMCVRMGMTQRTVLREIERHGLVYDRKQSQRKQTDRHPHVTKEALLPLIKQGFTMEEIAGEMGVHRETIRLRFRRWGLTAARRPPA